MPTKTNQIEIAWSEASGFEAKVYDNNGVQHDISSIFQEIKGATGKGNLSSRLVLGNTTLGTTLDFKPISKELKYNVDQKVIDQILEALP